MSAVCCCMLQYEGDVALGAMYRIFVPSSTDRTLQSLEPLRCLDTIGARLDRHNPTAWFRHRQRHKGLQPSCRQKRHFVFILKHSQDRLLPEEINEPFLGLGQRKCPNVQAMDSGPGI